MDASNTLDSAVLIEMPHADLIQTFDDAVAVAAYTIKTQKGVVDQKIHAAVKICAPVEQRLRKFLEKRDRLVVCIVQIVENREEIFRRIDEYTKAIQDEFSASHGLSSAVIIGQKDPQLELKPASRTAAADTLIGAFVGLLAAFALEWFPKKESQK